MSKRSGVSLELGMLLFCAVFIMVAALQGESSCDVSRRIRETFEVNLSHASDFSVSRCSNVTLSQAPEVGRYILRTKNERPWPQDAFCQAVNNIDLLGYTEYEVSVNLWNEIGNGQVNFGHPGLLFNARDQHNYDFVYFRPHSVSGCFQVGYLEGGVAKFTSSAACPSGPPVGRKWFNVMARVKDARASVYKDGFMVTQFQPHFHPGGQAGVIAGNGYENTVSFRDLMAKVPLSGVVTPPTCDFLTTEVGDLSVSGCRRQEPVVDGDHFVLHTSEGGSWPASGFCRAITRVGYRGYNHYTVSALLYNYNGNGRADFGHPGLLFNAKDSSNFDVIYFRPHSEGGCYQAGHVTHGAFAGTVSSKCPDGPPPGRTWFRVQIHVQGNKASVYKDGLFVVEMTTKYNPGGQVGILTANGYDNVISFKNLLVEVPTY